MPEDPTVVFWRIYYGNDEEWTSDDGPWTDAPTRDVQGVLLFRADGAKRLLTGRDYYWHDPTAVATERYGLTDDLSTVQGDYVEGAWVNDQDWLVLYYKMIADQQFEDPDVGSGSV